MKNTKILLAVIGTLILTWLLFGLIGYLLSDNVTFKACMIHQGTIICALGLGWIPAVIVGSDLDDTLK